MLEASEVDSVVTFLQKFGTGWRGFFALWSILLAWVLHGYLPERYKAKMDYNKFLKEHEERMKKLERAAQSRKRKEPDHDN